MQTYIVRPGDTLYGISKQFGVSVPVIKSTNSLSSNTITPNQVLKIPTKETTIIYTVKQGDSLYAIARKYDTTVDEIVSVNNLKTNNLSIGQQLRIPVDNNNTSQDYIIYTVKSGDNLYEIAKKYDTTVDKIKTLNKLSTNLLSIGQKLKISKQVTTVPNVEYETYVVKQGDSLYKIANQYQMTVPELMQINNLKSTSLSIGQLLKVKKNIEVTPPVMGTNEECYGEGYVEPSYVTYTVKPGDNLYAIARKYNTSEANLMALNDLATNNLSIGQVLKIKEVI